MMELTWSPDALDDLDEIYDIIAEDDDYKVVVTLIDRLAE